MSGAVLVDCLFAYDAALASHITCVLRLLGGCNYQLHIGLVVVRSQL
jgi:hypothetical protein